MKTGRTAAVLCAALFAALIFSPAIARSGVVLEWNEIMVALVEDQPPPLQNRFAAITQLAVFEAVNAVTGEYEPYLGTVTPLPGASADAAAVSAAHDVLQNYFPDRAAFLDAARASSLAGIPEGSAKDGGIAIGEMAAAYMIAARANDGSELPESYLPSSSNPGDWQLTPDCPATGGVFLHWRNMVPFAIRSADQFRSHPPPALTGGKYTSAYREVTEVGGRHSAERPQDRTNVARLYAVSSDAALWNPVARQIATTRRHSLSRNARTFALLNMALSDGGVAVMETKYHYNFWRPETAILAAGNDGNERTEPDSSYVPFITAPCFPSYPSGHATTSYAAREVLERIFGSGGHSITVSSPALPDVTLRYRKLKDITFDIDDARVYGGIHFRFDQDEGAEQGRRLGAYIYRHSLRSVRGCKCDDEENRE
ncbi:MAG: vanadium-dependent haloperoxidase [Woeseia sp.]